MKLKKFILIISIIFVILALQLNNCIFANTSYVWSDSSTSLLETDSDTETDLNLESGGAILIEQSTRLCFI